jgi:hypothetical protein
MSQQRARRFLSRRCDGSPLERLTAREVAVVMHVGSVLLRPDLPPPRTTTVVSSPCLRTCAADPVTRP